MTVKNLLNGAKREKVPKYIGLKLSEGLYDLVAAEADRLEIPMNELCARLVAESFGKPELGYVPRQKMGRPREDSKHAAVKA